MKYIISLMLVFFGLALGSAQNYSVEGTVQDFHDKTPLENVLVSFGKYSAKTDQKGAFKIKNVSGNIHFISFSSRL